MESDLKLRRLYRKLNDQYWAGELPDVAIWWEPCSSAAGLTFEIAGAEHLGITLDPCLVGLPKYTKLVLLHEMAHVRLWGRGGRVTDHGRAFDQEMQRLAGMRTYRKLL